MAITAPLLDESVADTVNLDVASQSIKLIVAAPTALPPGCIAPSETGSCPGRMVGLQNLPPVSVNVRFVIAAPVAGPVPELKT